MLTDLEVEVAKHLGPIDDGLCEGVDTKSLAVVDRLNEAFTDMGSVVRSGLRLLEMMHQVVGHLDNSFSNSSAIIP